MWETELPLHLQVHAHVCAYKRDISVFCVCVLIWKEKADVLKLAVDGLEQRWTSHSLFYRFKLKFSMSNFWKKMITPIF